MMKKIVLGVALAATMTSAFAWGEREQGALTGLVLGIAGANIANRHDRVFQYQQYPQPVIIQQPVCGYNVYCPPPQPPLCRGEYVFDRYGNIVGMQQVCR